MARSEHRLNPKSVLIGPSTKNVRIERLWLTLGQSKIHVWRRLFYSMEREWGLNPDNDIDIWCLHYVYIPRINAELEEWRKRKNDQRNTSDRLRNARRTPNEIFEEGIINMMLDDDLFQEMLQRERVSSPNDYGVGHERISQHIHQDSDQRAHFEWPSVAEIALTDIQRQFISDTINPLADDGHYGRVTWSSLRNTVNNMLSVW